MKKIIAFICLALFALEMTAQIQGLTRQRYVTVDSLNTIDSLKLALPGHMYQASDSAVVYFGANDSSLVGPIKYVPEVRYQKDTLIIGFDTIVGLPEGNPNAQPILARHYRRVDRKTAQMEEVNGTAQAIGKLLNTELSSGRNAYQDAELVYIPDNSDSLTTYSQKGGDFEYRRNSTALRTDSEGDIVEVDTNYVAIDFTENAQRAGLRFGNLPQLLNEHEGASVAYSLRLIDQYYTGSAIRVRRSSDNAEQDIGFNGLLLDTAGLKAFVGSGNGYVTVWYDQSGNLRHGTQVTASLQPTIVDSGSVIKRNGKPTINFFDPDDGTKGQFLNIPLWHNASDSNVWRITAYALNVSGKFPLLHASDPADQGLGSSHDGTTRQIRIFTNRAVFNFYDGTPITLDQLTLRTDVADRVNIKTYLNGVLEINGADDDSDFNMPTNYTLGNANITGSVNSDIDISETIMYNTDQTGNRSEMEAEIINHYNIP